ncbi:hypothetical protein BJ742DRAFT_187582 [Cladochytrium replicatum]|nr:hypothetical protein BJ742DRAFT_187582 [Cladochytrium replicatum]
MTVLCFLMGTYGDVRPFIALAEAFSNEPVTLAAPPEFEDHIRSHGVNYVKIRDSLTAAVTDSPEGKAFKNANVFNGLSRAVGLFKPLFSSWRDDIRKIISETNPKVIVLSTFPAMCALDIALDSNIPTIIIHTVPARPTSHLLPATVGMGYSAPFQFLNSFVWNTSMKAAGSLNASILREIGAEETKRLGATSLTGEYIQRFTTAPFEVETLYIYSPLLCPKPGDWTDKDHVTGPLVVHSAAAPLPENIEAFLKHSESANRPVVFFGLGSMLGIVFSASETTTLISKCVEGIQSTPCSIIVSTKGMPSDAVLPDVTNHADRILFTDAFLSHSLLFPRCAAVVHHGGSGTTHSALVYALPQTLEPTDRPAVSLIVPCHADQPFWAAAVHRLGASPAPLAPRGLTPAAFAGRINEIVDDRGNVMRERVKEICLEMRKEDGVARAAQIISNLIG